MTNKINLVVTEILCTFVLRNRKTHDIEKTYKIKIAYHTGFKTFFVNAENERQAVRRLAKQFLERIKTQNNESESACWCCMTEEEYRRDQYMNGEYLKSWEYVNCKQEGAPENVWLQTTAMEVTEYIPKKRTKGTTVVFYGPENAEKPVTVRIQKNSHYTDFTCFGEDNLAYEFTFNRGGYHFMLAVWCDGMTSLSCKPKTEQRQVWQDFKYGLAGAMTYEIRNAGKEMRGFGE